MPKLARVPNADRMPDRSGADVHRIPRFGPRYFAFLSYSHKDQVVADWLHDELEKFRVPYALHGRLTENGVIPKRLAPIFRDRHELAASSDLGMEIEEALASSQFLVVLCSPDAAKSRWTNAEIETFKRLRPEGCVLAAVVAGEPFASDIPGREGEECFPPALRQKYDRRGRPTGRRVEPLAADLREEADGRRMGFLKLVAGMLGVGLDELVQRETTRRHRRLAWLTAASLAGMVVTSGLALAAIEARDSARDQRREAEGLVAFMLGDLRDKLEPIGRLDALDGVGARVLAYYSKQDASELSDAGLLQRSRALNLTAQVAYSRGNMDVAERLYQQAREGTAEAVARDPDDPKRLYDHAQNVFWIGEIAHFRGRMGEAEAGMREYKRLADQMVALEPNNMEWRMEQQSAGFNLGIMLFERRKFREAIEQFTRSLATMEALATADPGNADYQVAVTESQTWLADARASSGQLAQAVPISERLVARLQELLKRTGDVVYQQKLVPAERSLAELYLFRGQVPQALAHFGAAAAHSEALLAREPQNNRWSYFSARARLDLAQGLLAVDRADAASAEAGKGCSTAQRLIAKDSSVQRWRAVQRDCLLTRARLAAATGNLRQSASFAQQAIVAARSINTTDRAQDRYGIAQALRLLGDIRQRLGDPAGARAAWSAGLAAIPAGVAEKPNEMAEHAMLLQRLGRVPEAQERAARLAAIGYRDPEFDNL